MDPTRRLTAAEAMDHPWLFVRDTDLVNNNLGVNLEQLKLFNAQRKLRAAIKSVRSNGVTLPGSGRWWDSLHRMMVVVGSTSAKRVSRLRGHEREHPCFAGDLSVSLPPPCAFSLFLTYELLCGGVMKRNMYTVLFNDKNRAL